MKKLNSLFQKGSSFFKKYNSDKTKPPILVIFLFSFLGVLFFSVLFRDLISSKGINFGSLLQFVGASGQTEAQKKLEENLKKVAEGQYIVEDSLSRCDVINQDGSKITTVFDNEKKGDLNIETKAGFNQGTGDENVHNSIINFAQKNNVPLGYDITLVVSPTEISSTVNFIKNANENGLMPIVRLCYDGGCQFKSVQQIDDFYVKINQSLGNSDDVFVGIVGPNEPVSEMDDFLGTSRTGDINRDDPAIQNDYRQIVQWSKDAAAALQNYRAKDGVGGDRHMYIAPAVFNMTFRSPTGGHNDRSAYLFSDFKIDPSQFDYLLGNTYNVAGQLADYWYKEDAGGGSVKDYVDNNDIPIIFTEFGFVGADSDFNNIKQAYQNLCEEDNVDGILFYRAIDELDGQTPEPKQSPPYSASQFNDIISTCDKKPSKNRLSKNVTYNCAFDSRTKVPVTDKEGKKSLQEYTYDSKDLITPITKKTETKITPSSNVKLKLKWDGSQFVSHSENSIQYWFPIRQTYGTNPAGTKERAFLPLAADIAQKLQIQGIIPQVQFAASIGSKNYPASWLGSGAGLGNLTDYLIETSYRNETMENSAIDPRFDSELIIDQVKAYIAKGTAIELKYKDENYYVQSGYSKDDKEKKTQKSFISDSLATRFFDKINNSTTEYFDILSPNVQGSYPYNPSNRKLQILSTSIPGFTYEYSKNEYVPGPEMKTKDNSPTSYSPQDVCYAYAVRHTDKANPNLIFTDGDLNCSSTLCSADKINEGKCSISPYYTQPAAAFTYVAGGDKIFAKSQPIQEDVESPSIPGFTTLFKEWDRVQGKLAASGFKIVITQNRGMVALADSITRDSNNPYVNGPIDYKFITDNDNIPAQLVDQKALGTSTIRSRIYYPLLGNLNYLQEIQTQYASSGELTDFELVANPFYNLSDKSLPNYNKTQILLPKSDPLDNGYLNPNTSLIYPLITHDQLEVCKVYDSIDAIANALSKIYSKDKSGFIVQARKLCPFDFKVEKDAKFNYITTTDDCADNDLILSEGLKRGFKNTVDFCKISCSAEVTQEFASQISTSKLSGGGIFVNISPDSEIIASAPNDPRLSIKDFAISNSLDVAINTNFFDKDTLTPLGLYGFNGNSAYSSNIDGTKNIEYALIKLKGPLDPSLENRVVDRVGNLIILDIRSNTALQSRFNFSSKDFDLLKNSIDWAVSGLPLLAYKGAKAPSQGDYGYNLTDYAGNLSQKDARTIIGFKSDGSLTFSTIPSANLEDLQNIAVGELGLQAAIALDGGGSTQLYNKNKFDTSNLDINSNNLFYENTTYWPKGDQGSTPRLIPTYIGAKKSKNITIQLNTSNCNDNLIDCNKVSSSNSLFYKPVSDKFSVIRGYGTAGKYNQHNGIDYSYDGALGSDIYAAKEGMVTFTGGQVANCYPSGGCQGLTIVIEHTMPDGSKLWTRYIHMKEIKVTVGQKVNTGDVIGIVGDTGYSSGPHLHFEIRKVAEPLVDDGEGSTQNPLGTYTLDPKLYLSNTSANKVGSGVPGQDLYSCKQTTKYNNIFDLVEAVSKSTGTPKELIMATLSVETSSLEKTLQKGVIINGITQIQSAPGDNVPILSGDPNQKAYFLPRTDGIDVKGVMQALCPTLLIYGYPKGNYSEADVASGKLPCEPWRSANGAPPNWSEIGRNYEETAKCVRDIGMNLPEGVVLDRTIVGHSLCIGAIEHLQNIAGKDLNNIDVNNFSSSNPIYADAWAYACGGNTGSECSDYAGKTWGRYLTFKYYWAQFKSGEFNADQIWNSDNIYNKRNFYYCTLLKDKGLICQ